MEYKKIKCNILFTKIFEVYVLSSNFKVIFEITKYSNWKNSK